MEKQTAVEWVIEQYINKNRGLEVFNKAIQMEKEQIKEAYNKGLSFAINPIPKPEDAKNYYKKRIKKTNDR
jgi:hypothetical protein